MAARCIFLHVPETGRIPKILGFVSALQINAAVNVILMDYLTSSGGLSLAYRPQSDSGNDFANYMYVVNDPRICCDDLHYFMSAL